ncbi:hypothetical protein R50073_15050 [Maricurvus nonylphenolicus]|uniref:MAPEG family protein n=1 Tax=Maricurvus nonylphenolicus TaxID=1008307 RepID=UPI0036F31A4F
MTSLMQPFFGMMLLTLLVWGLMYVRRLSFLQRQGLDPQEFVTPEKITGLVPESTNAASNNLKNLFEMPVIFYALCLYLESNQLVDNTYVMLAYGFLIFRVLHSVIHCTYNRVMHRFSCYLISSVLLWAMLIRIVFNS